MPARGNVTCDSKEDRRFAPGEAGLDRDQERGDDRHYGQARDPPAARGEHAIVSAGATRNPRLLPRGTSSDRKTSNATIRRSAIPKTVARRRTRVWTPGAQGDEDAGRGRGRSSGEVDGAARRFQCPRADASMLRAPRREQP